MAGEKPKKFLYGDLNTEVLKSVYTGKSTDSLELIVDNETDTIYGNVKWNASLGETNDTAYPGHLGKLNSDKLIELSEQLLSEIERAKGAEYTAISGLAVERNKREADIEALLNEMRRTLEMFRQSIDEIRRYTYDEANQSQIRDKNLQKGIDAEEADRKTWDATLLKKIEAETRRATSAETTLSVKLTSEVDRIDHATDWVKSQLDTRAQNLNERVSLEIDRAKGVEQKLSEKVTALDAYVKDVEDTLNKSDVSLQEELFKQISLLTDKDAQIEEDVAQEMLAREATDNQLTQRLSDVAASLNSESARAKRAEDEIKIKQSELEAKVDANKEDADNKIEQLNEIVSKEIMSQVQTKINQLNEKDEELADSISDLDTSLSNEISRARSEESAIRTSIETLSGVVQETYVPSVFGGQSDTTRVYAVRNDENIVCPIDNSPTADTLVIRTSEGTITVGSDTDEITYGDTDAVPKKYIDNLINSIESSLNDKIEELYSIDLICGGTAPIQ